MPRATVDSQLLVTETEHSKASARKDADSKDPEAAISELVLSRNEVKKCDKLKD